MAVLEYTARDRDGNSFSGVCSDVDSIAVLREDMAKMGDTLLKAKPKKSSAGKRVRVSQQQIANFA